MLRLDAIGVATPTSSCPTRSIVRSCSRSSLVRVHCSHDAATPKDRPVTIADTHHKSRAQAQTLVHCFGDSNSKFTSQPDRLGGRRLCQVTTFDAPTSSIINRDVAGCIHSPDGLRTRWVTTLPTLLAEWASHPPTLVLVMLGSLDASPTLLHLPLRANQANLETLVHGIQTSWGSHILLATPVPVDDEATA
ncbi:Aste57867_8239 [Aphanomyces stellatus]|uniref:Aste57867_8239 protein n=1 Tax=Aphanomyces stellatus TaxID=120398 RepID=A0A485KJS9_9STRA|nr:hypothetical protein As57867_008208 [Aphanomyces stellatus]VFT85126.1 Aste57867_8239 [Aphanomyces stellatus]